MKVVSQSHEWITPLNRDVTLKRIEQIARTCYKSEGAIKPGSDAKMVAMLCKNHHYAMIEHISLSCKFITDRGAANEIVRHRIGSSACGGTGLPPFPPVRAGSSARMMAATIRIVMAIFPTLPKRWALERVFSFIRLPPYAKHKLFNEYRYICSIHTVHIFVNIFLMFIIKIFSIPIKHAFFT